MTTVSTRDVYPGLGRELGHADINKLVMMTEPYRDDNGIHYTYMVNSVTEAFRLVYLSDLSATVIRGHSYYYVPREALSKWITVEEFLNTPNKVRLVHYIHYGLPC